MSGGGIVHIKLVSKFQNCPFFNAGYIGTGDSQLFGHFPLGEGRGPIKAVPHGENLPVPGFQALLEQDIQPVGFDPQVDDVKNVVIGGHDVQ